MERGACDQEAQDTAGDDSGHAPGVRVKRSNQLADQRAGDGPGPAPQNRLAERHAPEQPPGDGWASDTADQGADPRPEGRKEADAGENDVAVSTCQEYDAHRDHGAACGSGKRTEPNEAEGNAQNPTR
jgi:hypothetical protein